MKDAAEDTPHRDCRLASDDVDNVVLVPLAWHMLNLMPSQAWYSECCRHAECSTLLLGDLQTLGSFPAWSGLSPVEWKLTCSIGLRPDKGNEGSDAPRYVQHRVWSLNPGGVGGLQGWA